jgi:hypothetical protein
MPFGLRAASREDPAGSSVEEGTVDVGWFLEPFVELVPRTSRGARGANHELAVDNRGNVRLNAEVDATDADRLLAFDVNPPAVVVEPAPSRRSGSSRSAVLRRSRQAVPADRPARGLPPSQIDGTLPEAMLPPWSAGRWRPSSARCRLICSVPRSPGRSTRPCSAIASPVADLRGDVNDALGARAC